MSNEPYLEMPLHRVLCRQHGEPFRAQWPLGYATFSVEGLGRLFANPDFERETSVEGDKDASMKAIGEALDRKPICCRLEPTALLSLYQAARIGVDGVCENCALKRLGTRYRISNFWGRVKRIGHICFECVIAAKPTTDQRFKPGEK